MLQMTTQAEDSLHIRQIPITVLNRNWETIQYFILKSLPAVYHENTLLNQLVKESIFAGRIVVWSIQIKTASSCELIGIYSTVVQRDAVTNGKNLLLFTMTGVRPVAPIVFTKGLAHLKQYAKEQGCSSILAYTGDSNINAIAERLGFKRVDTLLLGV